MPGSRCLWMLKLEQSVAHDQRRIGRKVLRSKRTRRHVAKQPQPPDILCRFYLQVQARWIEMFVEILPDSLHELKRPALRSPYHFAHASRRRKPLLRRRPRRHLPRRNSRGSSPPSNGAGSLSINPLPPTTSNPATNSPPAHRRGETCLSPNATLIAASDQPPPRKSVISSTTTTSPTTLITTKSPLMRDPSPATGYDLEFVGGA
mmetsp:Transcript_9905/g.25176  ORF Transcript_9905/g.25176 Transcript_9905/m.25176 type:complete len:205 (+) Transcript_9905:84-698(+)